MCNWLSMLILQLNHVNKRGPWFMAVVYGEQAGQHISPRISYDDVIKWENFQCYWPFVRGIHRSPVNSPHKGQWRWALMFSKSEVPQNSTLVQARNFSLHWRHNNHNGVSDHQSHGCLLNRLFRRRSKKVSKLRVTGLCVGNSPGPHNSPHKWPVTRKMFPFDDVIMYR